MQHKTVSILGCGWLGVPLAQRLLSEEYAVKGSVTAPEKLEMLRSAGILPYRLILNETGLQIDDPGFFDCDVLIISIPPRRIPEIGRVFPAQIGQLIPWIREAGIQKVIFISSTSVYPENIAVAREGETANPEKESGKALVRAENMLLEQTAFQTTVLRFGGLIGASRNPARFLLKAAQTLPNTPVNLIHLDDCTGIISAILKQELWGETLNACCPGHPLKKEFYALAARISGLPEPTVADQPEQSKVVDSGKLIRLLNYRFIYPSPLDYLNSLQAQHPIPH